MAGTGAAAVPDSQVANSHETELALQPSKSGRRITRDRVDEGEKHKNVGGLLSRVARGMFRYEMSNRAGLRQQQLTDSGLGKYARERQMPAKLAALLQKGGETINGGLLDALQKLLSQCNTTQYAYLCDPVVLHISKLKGEGGFCGYRNIQMLISYIIAKDGVGSHYFRGQIPSIFDIQELIEAAWDKGINPQGRVETGGIRGTRKHIGTAEARAMFKGLDIPCNAQAYTHRNAATSRMELISDVEQYFKMAATLVGTEKVSRTNLPPMYLQHQGHSMTIIGFERMIDETANVLVFDPSRGDSEAIIRLIGHDLGDVNPNSMLSPYRRGPKYLIKYGEFEILRLGDPVP